MGKVKLPREVANAIDIVSRMQNWTTRVMEALYDNRRTLSYEMGIIKNYFLEDDNTSLKLFDVIVNGYEVEETPEEQILKIYQSHSGGEVNSLSWQYRMEIRTILDLLNVQIKGVNA